MELIVGRTSGVERITAESEAKLVVLQRQYDAEKALAEQHGDNVVVLDGVFAQRRSRIMADAANARASALRAEAQATLGNVDRLGKAAHTLAKKVGAGQGVLAAIERAMEIARAARETAAAAGSFASGDFLGAAAHGVAAGGHLVAAAKFGKVPGGGGSSAGAPSAPTPAAPSSAHHPRRREAGGSSKTVINMNSIIADQRSVRTAVVDAMSEAGDGQPIAQGA